MRVLISVSDKTGIVRFAKGLIELGAELISTGGTLAVLKENGVAVTPIDEVTQFPEMLDGRVKTLHPKIHGGLLALRQNPDHMATCSEHGIGLIDMVVVNLYPFQDTIAKPNVTVAEAIEQIDIGGPSMLRSAAKNYQSVAVVVSPSRYDDILDELTRHSGSVSQATRELLAAEAFKHTAQYDSIISGFFQDKILSSDSATDAFPSVLTPRLQKISDLRYGENPHQRASFYRFDDGVGLPSMTQLHGKELSYNNLLDMDAAWQIAASFDIPGAAVIKHNNPCGAATGDSISDAYKKAHDADPVSAFGSIIGLNRSVDEDTARAISETFVEVVLAPSFDQGALDILMKKPSIRIIEIRDFSNLGVSVQYRHLSGGMLVQDRDDLSLDDTRLNVVTNGKPSSREMSDMKFAFNVVKYVKSNAIVVAKGGVTLGIGAGQMSRVEAVEIAIKKAGDDVKGAVLASDAFFPFSDSVELCAKAGISAIIQPGGSKRDQDSIDACHAHGLGMVFTGSRHFRH